MMDWQGLVGGATKQVLWWQMGLRAVIVLIYGLAAIRLVGRRAFGRQNALDIVVAIVIGSSLSRTLTGNAPLAATLAASTIFLLVYFGLDHLAARWPLFSKLIKGSPVSLMQGGKLQDAPMRATSVTTGDIEEAARSAGHAGLGALDEAVLERSGQISTIARKKG